ncbi:hypothetical protein RG47T_3529 [Mucilaginibacter polytrichastri]|uniref:Uncharacterized protein n=1 Tax=Mucilaginibacter polytrichastri TaxID=1302689 RepID=A0A1Q6A218_9SPHI|nr:hypothetical protein RG47T_3529 [Mucilaginibacter polytrichastri]
MSEFWGHKVLGKTHEKSHKESPKKTALFIIGIVLLADCKGTGCKP